jgi:flagellar basal body-associated protein FliL
MEEENVDELPDGGSDKPKEGVAADAAQGSPKKIVFIVALILLAGIGGTGGYFLTGVVFEDLYRSFSKEEAPSAEMVEFSGIVVNPTESRESRNARMVMVSMSLEVMNSADAAFLKANTAQMRDLIISLLASKTTLELSTFQGRELVRNELTFLINEKMENKSLNAIYFSEYVLQ